MANKNGNGEGIPIDLNEVVLPDARPEFLTERDWRIARARFGPQAERASLRDLADELDLTRERIRQLESKIAYKLLFPDFAEMRGFIRMGLINNGFTNAAEVETAPDEVLLAIDGLGAVGLAEIRERFPRGEGASFVRSMAAVEA
jgi:hypothetical protein